MKPRRLEGVECFNLSPEASWTSSLRLEEDEVQSLADGIVTPAIQEAAKRMLAFEQVYQPKGKTA